MIEQVIAAGNQLGESPVWRPEEHALYWIDVPKGTIRRYALSNQESFLWRLPAPARTDREFRLQKHRWYGRGSQDRHLFL
jgi:sugar lactone lactonase YvrE